MDHIVNRLVEAISKKYNDNKAAGIKVRLSDIYDTEADKIGVKYVAGLKSRVMSELSKRGHASKAKNKIKEERKNGKIFPGWHFSQAQIDADTERAQR